MFEAMLFFEVEKIMKVNLAELTGDTMLLQPLTCICYAFVICRVVNDTLESISKALGFKGNTMAEGDDMCLNSYHLLLSVVHILKHFSLDNKFGLGSPSKLELVMEVLPLQC